MLFATSFLALTVQPAQALENTVYIYGDLVGLTTEDKQFITDYFNMLVTQFVANQTILAELKSGNPDLYILGYRDLIGAYESDSIGDWATVNANEAWFFHDVDGGRVTNTEFGWYLMNISSTGWQNYYSTWVNTQLTGSYFNGVFADDTWYQLTPYLPFLTNTSALPVSSLNSWHSDVESMLTYVKTNLPVGKDLIVNTDEYLTDDYVSIVDGKADEGMIHAGWWTPYDFPSNYEVRTINHIDGMIRELNNGKIFISDNGVSGGTESQIENIVKFSYCGALMATDINAYFSFNNWFTGDGYYSVMGNYVLLGDSTGEYYFSQNIYMREFVEGLVLFNPSGTEYSISLTGYHFFNDSNADSFTLGSYSGEILFLDEIEPTPTPTPSTTPTPTPSSTPTSTPIITPTPTAPPVLSQAQTATNQVFTNVYIALSIAVVSTLIAGCYIIIAAFNSGNGNARFGVGLVIVSIIEVVIGVVVVSAFQGSMGTVGIILLSIRGVT
jgi:hypothetical protein